MMKTREQLDRYVTAMESQSDKLDAECSRLEARLAEAEASLRRWHEPKERTDGD